MRQVPADDVDDLLQECFVRVCQGLRDVPHREIAERLRLSVSGVKSRVQRGRAMLRDRLLACCALQFDSRGGLQDYRRRSPGSCDC